MGVNVRAGLRVWNGSGGLCRCEQRVNDFSVDEIERRQDRESVREQFVAARSLDFRDEVFGAQFLMS